jgi:hypothetical protein
VQTSTLIRRIDAHMVTLHHTWSMQDHELSADVVVVAATRAPRNDLGDALEGAVSHLYVVGDALAPRGLLEATYEGHRFARTIGDQAMSASVTEAMYTPTAALR